MAVSEEIWKEVPGYSGLYDVSNKGRVRTYYRRYGHGSISSEPYELHFGGNNYGYQIATLMKSGRKRSYGVHRLVAMTFKRRINKNEVVHHRDNIKIHNEDDNLIITSRARNTKLAMIEGLNPGPTLTGSQKGKRFTDNEVLKIRKMYKDTKISMMKIAEKYDRNLASIFHLIHRTSYNHI